MKKPRSRPEQANETREAMNRVLGAERDMAAALEDCRQQAEQIVEDGRAMARRIERRADQRIQNMQRRCAEAIAALDAASSEQQRAADGARPAAMEDKALAAAVDRLAIRMTTADDDDR